MDIPPPTGARFAAASGPVALLGHRRRQRIERAGRRPSRFHTDRTAHTACPIDERSVKKKRPPAHKRTTYTNGAAPSVLQREYSNRMSRNLSSLIVILVAALGAAGAGCGRTELNLCKTGVNCHVTTTPCPGGNCDGGQPDGPTTCGAGLQACGETCTDVRSDSSNCGR